METIITHKYPIGTKLKTPFGRELTVIGVTLSPPPGPQRPRYLMSDGQEYSAPGVDSNREWTEVKEPNCYLNVYADGVTGKHDSLSAAKTMCPDGYNPEMVGRIAVYDDHIEIVEGGSND